MDDPFTHTSPSPDAHHTAIFRLGGEIRFGPFYFSLAVDGYSFGQRIFGETHVWSPSSNLLAVQEWFTTDYSEGPITGLLLIDVARGREASLAQVTKGFVVPEVFEEWVITYRTEQAGKVKPSKLDISTITQWQQFG